MNNEYKKSAYKHLLYEETKEDDKPSEDFIEEKKNIFLDKLKKFGSFLERENIEFLASLIKDELKSDQNFCLKAISLKPYAMKFVADTLKNDQNFCLESYKSKS